MTFLLDTTAFSDLMREHPKVDARLASLASTDRAVICPFLLPDTHTVLGVMGASWIGQSA